MKLKNFFLKNKVYRSIDDMPIWNWKMIHIKQDTKYVYVSEDYESVRATERSEERFGIIYAEFFNTFSLTSGYIELLKAQKKIAIKRLEAYILGDKTKLTFADLEEEALKAKYNENEKIDYDDLIVTLEQDLGMMIDQKKMSVKSFYTHMKVSADKNSKLKMHYSQWQKR